MVHLPKLPDPESVFSVIDRASGVIDKGLGFIDKVSDRLDRLGITEESPPTPTTAPQAADKAPPEQKTTNFAQEPETVPQQDIATACVACAIGHFSTSSGLLKEALRFKGEGMTSNEILDRIAAVLEEQNTLERVDLTPERLQKTPGWLRAIAEEALTQSRQLRHKLESIQSVDELEPLAADTKRYYIKLFRQWYRGRFGYLGTKKAEAIAQRVGGA